MIEGFVQIGRASLEDGNFLDNLIEEVEPIKNKKVLQILKLNFKEDHLEVDVKEEMSEYSAEKYLHVGSADGANSPQWYVTSKNVKYHLTETIYNLTTMDLGENLNNKLEGILEKFYFDFGEKVKSNKYRYTLNLHRYLDAERSNEDIYNELKKKKAKDKEIADEITKEFEKILKNIFGIKLNEIGLFTILIDDIPLFSYKEYQDKIVEAKRPESIDVKEGSTIKHICSICGSAEKVTSDLSKMKIKYYTTNQVIFASDIDNKNYYKNMKLCQDCMDSLLTGEIYVKNNLSTRIGDLKIYLIPHFIFGSPLSRDELDHAVEKINKSFNTAKNLRDIDNFEQDIYETLNLKDEESYFMLNFLFYKQNQKATKIQRLIKDVAPTIFGEIGEASNKANMQMREALQSNKFNNYIDLQKIYYMIPIKVKQGDATQYRDILDIYDSLFIGRKINKQHLIDKFVDAINVYRINKEGFNIKQKLELDLEFYLLNANMTIKFFENLSCIKEGEKMDISKLKVKDEIKTFIDSMSYNEQQSAMFILGFLIGEIGNAQYQRLDGNKPILNKLNFNGIDKTKILRLSNDVFAKLKQEKIRAYNEVTYYELKRLIDSNINTWKLNKNENLFYILSGYSFATTKPILKEDKENE